MSVREVQRDPDGPLLIKHNNTLQLVCRAPLADGGRCPSSFAATNKAVAQHFARIHRILDVDRDTPEYRNQLLEHRQQLESLCKEQARVQSVVSFAPSPQPRAPSAYGARPVLGYACPICGWSLPFDAAALAEHTHRQDHHAGADS